jgi:ABC-type Na+ efflux pump permease subunit
MLAITANLLAMWSGPIDESPRPPALPLVFAAVGLTGFGLLAWMLVALAEATGDLQQHAFAVWALFVFTLLAPSVGSAAAYAYRRWWPFMVGVALTFVPVGMAVLLVLQTTSGAVGGD